MKVLKLSLLVLLTLLQQSFSQNILDALRQKAGEISHAISRELVDVVNPLMQGVVKVANSQCNSVKNILRLDYEHTDGDQTPNFDNLTLNCITKDHQVAIPLNAATTELLPILKRQGDLAKLVVKIFLHGFTDNPSKGNFEIVNEAYRSVGVDVILALDASSLIADCYLCSSTNAQHIGNRLGEVFAELYLAGLSPEYIHLVGHSLGAHAAGFAAKQFTKSTGRKVGRVTGLDPAGPCFEVDENLRLKSTDAVFVDVIHSNAGVLGIAESVGHVDFWPNGGYLQPDCPIDPTCSHNYAVLVYVASILDPNSFPAVRCNGYDDFAQGISEIDVVNFMGEGATSSNLGSFCLQTNGESPLAKGTEGMTYVNHNGFVKTLETSFANLLRG